MKPYYEGPGVQIYHGDCREVLPTLAAESIDSIVTDPPYHLTTGKRGGSGTRSENPDSPAGRARIGTGFMGKAWDGGDVAFQVATWEAMLRVAKPGAHLLAFGGTRTHHRLVVAIEDAGWEIRDTLMWVYGSGFPKSLDVSKAIDKAAGAEREVTGERRGGHGKGGTFSSDFQVSQGYRPAYTDIAPTVAVTAPATDAAREWNGWGTALKPAWEPIILARKPLDGTVAANVLAHGTGALNIDACRIGTGADKGEWPITGRQRADNVVMTRPPVPTDTTLGRWPANVCLDESAAAMLDEMSGERKGTGGATSGKSALGQSSGWNALHNKPTEIARHNDTGGASRFFYTAKASRAERNGGDAENDHPTVKPLDLMRWLARLTKSPHGGIVLDPFMGSGSTLVAAREEFRPCIGIELDERYCEIAARRLSQGVLDFGGTP